jgi:aldose 1-epimerase
MRRAVVAGGGFRAEVLPDLGAGIASLRFNGRDLLRPATAAEIGRRNHSGLGSFLMAPWTNRLDAGKLRFGGRTWHLPINRPQDRTAIHGFLRELPWRVRRRALSALTLAVDATRTPWRVSATLDLRFGEGVATMTLSLVNRGRRAVPVGIGLHPWFPRTPRSTLRFAATHGFPRNARNLPVSAEPARGMSGPLAAQRGHDGHWSGWDGTAVLDGMRLTAGGAFRNLHVYVPAQDPVVCVEPVSHVPDVLNRPDLARHGAMRMLAPGRRISGWMTLRPGT